MANERMRRRVAWEAARLLYQREESEYFRAKRKAARRLLNAELRPSDLPTNREIRDQIKAFARLDEGQRRAEILREMRLEALRMMKLLRAFRPRLLGSALTGHVRPGVKVHLHLFADNFNAVCAALDSAGIAYRIQRKSALRPGQDSPTARVAVSDRFPVQLAIYPADKANQAVHSPLTGQRVEHASINELEALLASQDADGPSHQAVQPPESRLDRFQVYEMLLLPLEKVRESRKHHPEGDALYHSLQVFELARNELPYDEEFLLAALLHDVGKAIDPHDHVAAALEALDGFITPRTAWLIEHHMEAAGVPHGMLGVRLRRRLEASEDFQELLLLGRCDREGRRTGVRVPDVHEALDYLRDLARVCGE